MVQTPGDVEFKALRNGNACLQDTQKLLGRKKLDAGNGHPGFPEPLVEICSFRRTLPERLRNTA